LSGFQERASVYQKKTKAPDSLTAAEIVRTGLDSCPRIRVGYLPTTTLLTVFSGPEELGQHGYRPNGTEKNGIVYTCKAGHIDIGHARKATDWTLFLTAKTYQQIIRGETEYTFRLYEPSRHFVRLTYPENWEHLSQKNKEQIAYEVSIRLGQYLAYVATNWHEIITWFGYRSKGLEPEFPSAFTWEEVFSNLFGTHIAAIALRDTKHTYNEAVTLAFDKELQRLDAQPGNISKRASESVRGKWFSGDYYFITMNKRNLDMGLDDGFVTPWLIPSVSECEGAEAQPYPVPDIGTISKYGFSVKFETEPRIWQGSTILNIAYPQGKPKGKRIEPAIHLAPIMDYIKKDAVRRYGPDADRCP
jgi:hypothetical protein